MKLIEFEKIFRTDVAPLYIQNQKIFDQDGVHGCLHISRSLIIGKLLSNKLKDFGVGTHIDKILYAIAFHDSGRKANGIDYWENDSSIICRDYLISKGIPDYDYTSSLIVKKNNKIDINYFVCKDTDSLEIVRPTTGVGISNFNTSYLELMPVFNSFYSSIMNEVFYFILETEGMNKRFFDENSLSNLILYLKFKSSQLPMLYDASIT